eukprot:1832084-Prymnesium_polylepis.1
MDGAKKEKDGVGPFSDWMKKRSLSSRGVWESEQKAMVVPPPGYIEPDSRSSTRAQVEAAITAAAAYWIPAFQEEEEDGA